MLYWRLLWRLQAAGETLSVGKSLSLIFLYLVIFAKPLCALVCNSKRREVLASVDLDNIQGTCIIAAYICSVDHTGPQLTGHPPVENYCRRGFALWWVAHLHGHISTSLPSLYLIFIPSFMELSLLIAYFADIFRCWDVWAKDFMFTFVSVGVVYGGYRLVPLSFLGTYVMPLSEFWNSTCWKLDGSVGVGDGVYLIFSMVDVGRVYLLPVKIGIGVYMGGCLSSATMFPSFISSSTWDEHEKLWSGVSDWLWHVQCKVCFIIWILFCAKVPCNSTRIVVKHILYMNVEMKHEVILPCVCFLLSPALTAWTQSIFWSPCLIYLPSAWPIHLLPWGESSYSKVWIITGTYQGCIPCCTLISLRCGNFRSLLNPWSVNMYSLLRYCWWSAYLEVHVSSPWACPYCCRICLP